MSADREGIANVSPSMIILEAAGSTETQWPWIGIAVAPAFIVDPAIITGPDLCTVPASDSPPWSMTAKDTSEGFMGRLIACVGLSSRTPLCLE